MRTIMRALLSSLLGALRCMPALAGPPYVTDDPEPTNTGHFENYLYVQGTHAAGAFAAPRAGVEFNYGGFADAQLSWDVPLNPNPGPGGMGLVWSPLGAGVKYRFIEEDNQGWRPQVAIFPHIFIPVGTAAHSTPVTELLPVWLQKSFGPWTTFGGGGWTSNPGAGNRSFAVYGCALQRQISDKLALGFEVFGETRSSVASGASTAIGLAALYDFSDHWHLIGSVNTGLRGRENDEYSYIVALKWTNAPRGLSSE